MALIYQTGAIYKDLMTLSYSAFPVTRCRWFDTFDVFIRLLMYPIKTDGTPAPNYDDRD